MISNLRNKYSLIRYMILYHMLRDIFYLIINTYRFIIRHKLIARFRQELYVRKLCSPELFSSYNTQQPINSVSISYSLLGECHHCCSQSEYNMYVRINPRTYCFAYCSYHLNFVYNECNSILLMNFINNNFNKDMIISYHANKLT